MGNADLKTSENRRAKRVKIWEDFEDCLWLFCERHGIPEVVRWKMFRELCDYMEEEGM